MSTLFNFIQRHSVGNILVLVLEEYLFPIVRIIPGYEGMLIRWIFFKVTFKKIGAMSYVYTNTHIMHAYNIAAGDHLAINKGAHIDGRGGIAFGDNVLVGPNVFIGSSNHVIDSGDTPRMGLGHIPMPTKIGSNVWIGANAVICPGVIIGDNSIIAAGSVVTKDVDRNVLVAGNPARYLKDIELLKN